MRFLPETDTSRVFGVADYESKVIFKKLIDPRLRIQDCGSQIRNKTTKNVKNEILTSNQLLGVFWIHRLLICKHI